MDRRNEVINEALVARKRIQLNMIQIPKRRLLMKSTPPAASDSGQQREKRSVTNTDTVTQARDPMKMGIGGKKTPPTALPANSRRRISMMSEPVAVTTQEAIDREMAVIIASV